MDGSGGNSPMGESQISEEMQDQLASASSTASLSSSSATPPTLPPTAPPPNFNPGSSNTVGFKDSLSMLKPSEIVQSVTSQLMGEKTEQQKQAEQQLQQKIEQRSAQEEHSFQAHQQREKAEQQRRVDETLQLKQQTVSTKAQFTGNSAANINTQINRKGDLSEHAIIKKSYQDALSRQQREANARQAMMAPSGPQKGAQPEGGKKQTSMIRHMNNGDEQDTSQKRDSLQRQREQTVGE